MKIRNLTGAIWNDGSSYPSEEVLADRHFKGANISCFDGHVEWWDPRHLGYERQSDLRLQSHGIYQALVQLPRAQHQRTLAVMGVSGLGVT